MEQRSDFYVYAHTRATDGSIFYIGKGVKRRAWEKSVRNKYWRNIVAKHEYKITILLNNLTEEEAFILEKQLIATLGRDSLCNMTDGGEGGSGYVHTKETRKGMSERQKGRKLSEETKAKISKKLKGKKYSPWSEESRKRISEDRKGRKQSPEHIAKREAAKARNRLLRNLT